MAGFQIAPPADDHSLCQISFRAKPETIKTWRLKWLLSSLQIQLRGLNLAGSPNRAQLRALRNQAVHGIKVDNTPLGHEPKAEDRDLLFDGKAYGFDVNTDRTTISLVIFDATPFGNASFLPQVWDEAKKQVSQIEGGKVDSMFMKKFWPGR